MIVATSVSDRIKEARLNAFLTQEELAQRLGLTKGAVFKWESGAGSPYPKTLKKIAEVTGKPISFFTGQPEDDPAPDPERTVPVMTQQAYRSRTADSYARYWRAELGHLHLSQVTPGHIEAWRSKRLAEVKGATVNRAVSFLRRLFNLAARDGLCTKNPASSRLVPKLKEQRKIQYLSEEEEVLLLRACYPRLRAAVELAILTGMRAGEQFGMRQEDVRGDSIVLPRTKSGKTRYLPIPARAQSILSEQLATPGEWVWPGKDPSESCDPCAMNRSLKRACERAGIRVVSWHALRHTFGTRAVQRSDVRTVCEAMGHSSISVTEIYLQVIGSRLDALMREQKSVNSGEVLVKFLSKNMLKYARNRFETSMECAKNMP